MSTNFTLKCLYKPFLFHSKQFSLSFSGPDTNQLEVCGSEWLYQCPTDLDSTLSTTGYMISYTGGGGSTDSVYVSSDSTDSYTLTGLSTGDTYNITVAGTSDHFFSGNIEWETVVSLMFLCAILRACTVLR